MAQPSYFPLFTPAEQFRLAIYQAAVAAGLYADAADGSEPPYRFTTQELERLMVYKAAIAAGMYSDQLGPHDGEG